jgi:hypothetical protein
MSITAEHLRQYGQEQRLEREYWEWLIALPPWQQHMITKPQTGRELDWHDDFVAGRVTLAELEEILNGAA